MTAASKCAREAKHFHKVLEVILAYGNYMNSGKRGGVFGFKLSSLDSLAILKAPSDRSLTLLHVIVESIEQKFPELLAFPAELKFIDKAAGGWRINFGNHKNCSISLMMRKFCE